MDGKIHCEDGSVVSAYWPEGMSEEPCISERGAFCCPVGHKGKSGPIGLVRGRLYKWEDFYPIDAPYSVVGLGLIVRFVDMYDDKLVEVRHHEKTYYVSSYDLSLASEQEVNYYLKENL